MKKPRQSSRQTLSNFSKNCRQISAQIGQSVVNYCKFLLTWANQGLIWTRQAGQQLWSFCIKIIGYKFQVSRTYLRQKADKVWALMLLAPALFILASFFFPGYHAFEGKLTVESMSFIYTGEDKKLFLKEISEIPFLEIQGVQQFTLSGGFTSDTIPNLARQQQLEISLPFPSSRIIISPVANSEISLKELRLRNPPNDQDMLRVNGLQYDTKNNQISFCLQSAKKEETPKKLPFAKTEETPKTEENPDSCWFPGSFAPDHDHNTIIGSLILNLGQQPLRVSLENFNIPQLGIAASPDNPNFLDLTINPTPDDLELSLISPVNFRLDLPKTTPTASRQWLRGNLPVKDVQFYRSDITGDVRDDVPTSTIIKGEIRIADKSLTVGENQFLLIKGKPGLKQIRYIQIQPDKGLQVRLVGKSHAVGVGLDPQFPVQEMKPLWLSTLGLSSEAVTALVSFCAAVVGYLLPYFFTPSSNP